MSHSTQKLRGEDYKESFRIKRGLEHSQSRKSKPALLDIKVMVDYYGSPTPLKNLQYFRT